ncbi:MAG: ABC transporter permease [Candidatus Methanomethylophilaceae archaeon]|nr:ABC transporter permease [Candidatus Methanomethylophilaceae archaeon]MDY5872990.1 ABC transporter permease [Candidatus Methanomethylophilaceae archaeon]
MNPILSFFDEVWRVYWADFRHLIHKFPSIMIGSLVLPLLYLFAFGYGLGNDIDMGEVDYISFMIPGVIALTTLSSSFSSTASKVMIQRKFYSSFDELTLCPIRTSSFIVGKSLVGVMRCLISCTILICLGLLITKDMHVTLPLIISILVASFTFSFMGLLIGLIVSEQTQLSMFTNLTVLPMTFLCGTLFSIDKMPAPVQTILSVLPLTPVTECIRNSALCWEYPIGSLAVVLVFCAAFFIADYYIIKTCRY